MSQLWARQSAGAGSDVGVHGLAGRALISLLLLLFSAAGVRPICAQVVTATLTGTVRDSSGASIPNATVTATQTSTGVSRTTKTSSDGVFNPPYLSPGTYRVEVAANGFTTFVQNAIPLEVSTVARLNATLNPGNAQQTVTVTAAPPALQTESAEVARNFNARITSELPVANRNFQALAGLAAGVTPPVQSFTSIEDPQGTTFFNANGQGNSANNTLVDGVDNTDPLLGLSIWLPTPEVVQEVHVSTSNYSAEFGHVAGAVVNVLTKSGTNEFHGSAWEFNRVAALAGRDFFNKVGKPKPGLTRNEFGATFGGPIIKDKTFFFAGYQGRYLRQASTSINTVPGAAFLNGDFSSVPGLALYDPNTGNADGTGRQPFANNIIPQREINPIAQRLNAYLPQPNLPGIINNYVTNVPYSYDGNSYNARVDHNFTEFTKLSAEMATSHYSVQQSGVLGNVISNSEKAQDYTVTGIVNLTHGFSPTLLTELRGPGGDRGTVADPAIAREVCSASPTQDPCFMRTTDYAVVSCLPSLTPGRKLLILAGLTTSGTEAAAQFVTSPEGIQLMEKALPNHHSSTKFGYPVFQFLLKVSLDHGLDVLHTECIARRVRS